MDLKLDTNGDLDLTNGELSLVDGLDRIRQQTLIRFRTFRGEWFRDQRVGMPYYQEILGVKPFSEALVAARFRAAYEGIPGAVQLTDISLELDSDRVLQGQFTGIAEVDGEPNVFSEDFILT